MVGGGGPGASMSRATISRRIFLWELGYIDPLNKVPFKRAISTVKKGYLLRGPPSAT